MNYKSLLLLFIGLSTISFSSKAQRFTSGFKGGFNFSSLYIDNVEDRSIRPGFHVGAFQQAEIADYFALHVEALYITAGNRTIYDNGILNGELDFNLNYVQVPVMLNFKVGNKLDIVGGMYASYLINANTSYDGSLIDNYSELDRDNFNHYDYGFVTGIGYNIETIQIGVRYNLGIQEIANNSLARDYLGDSKNVIGQIYLAIGL